MKVDRCVCLSVSFEQLKAVALASGLDFETLKARTRCCSNCSLCAPYVRRMLETGETVFVLDRKNPAPVAGKTVVSGVCGLGVSKPEPKNANGT
jgi:bacterioferritin-associated ferredoxin